jgi:hypothetical protein
VDDTATSAAVSAGAKRGVFVHEVYVNVVTSFEAWVLAVSVFAERREAVSVRSPVFMACLQSEPRLRLNLFLCLCRPAFPHIHTRYVPVGHVPPVLATATAVFVGPLLLHQHPLEEK